MNNEIAYNELALTYSDEELQNAILVPDVHGQDLYNAILSVALERNLISSERYEELFWPDLKVEGDQAEVEEEEISLDTSDFWKCPQCGQTIENAFDACWNCQKGKPDEPEHPDTREILEYQIEKPSFNFFKTATIAIVSGIIVLALNFWDTGRDYLGFHILQIYYFIAGGLIILLGVIIMMFGIYHKAKN